MAGSLHQMYKVQSSHLSRWVGGAFGMYTGIHYSTRRAILSVKEPRRDFIIAADKSWEIVQMLSHPNEADGKIILENFSQNFPAPNELRLSIWEMEFDPRNMNAKYGTIFSITHTEK